ncbi:uncharacterized protein BT62DRAFT_1008338 [Guyanagaster necrorhizus]|uniref:Uncharacterized protein n=1 Tax=Guyanagaster necrorhizus TaxID=856835 RepID=A0A9P7VMX0_9AGAR|nr:uncharacterized protein BT62DRAFT_1008338 [Guyanagaster necrorhizus MCA 3950]KAG7444133.1 hypothetical protein BT62DRAFT_1008338 [Guyanagaster necrorhizus MCA 3950]
MPRVFTFALLLGLLTQVVLCQDTNLREVKQAFDDANISISRFDPMFLLEVSLPQTSCPAVVLKAGVQLPRNATVGPPLFALSGYGIRDGPFVVAAVDPDAPTPQNPKFGTSSEETSNQPAAFQVAPS